MTMTRSIPAILTAAAIVALTAITPSWAEKDNGNGNGKPEGPPPECRHHGKPGERFHDFQHKMQRHAWRILFKDITLNEYQTNEIKDLKKELQDARRAWFKENKDTMHELKEAIHEAHFVDDQQQIDTLREQIHELMQSAPNFRNMDEKVQNILTYDQYQQYLANKETLEEKIREHKEHWRDHREKRRKNKQEETDE